MRIKSHDEVAQPDYRTRNPKDPLPSPGVVGNNMQNGHVISSLNDATNQKLDARSSQNQQEQNNKQQNGDGQNHASHASLTRNDHEMAVKTKVISVKRDIQPSGTSLRKKPSFTLPQTSLSPTDLHGVPQNSVQRNQSQDVAPEANDSVFSPTVKSPSVTSYGSSHVPAMMSYNSEQSPSMTSQNGSHTPSSISYKGLQSPSMTSQTRSLSPLMMSYNNNNGQNMGSDSIDGMSQRLSSGSIPSTPSSATASFPFNGMPPPLPSPNYYNMTSSRSTSLSSYNERDIERLSAEVSHASVSSAPKFIRDTTSYWYKPDITREQALAILKEKEPGSFVVRDSRCFPGAFGLALKVDRLPIAVQQKPGTDITDEYVRHFLIELSSRGVKLKGCPNEPVFGSLSALVFQHSITPLALPCKLIIPTEDQEIPPTEPQNGQNEAAAAAELLKQGAACNVLYIGSMDTESLTGPKAIENAITKTFKEAMATKKTSIVHFKVSPQGITLTDNQRKIFFRRHYSTATVTYCGLDPQGNGSKKEPQRRWDATESKGAANAWLFGFVARKQMGSSDNACHVFAELDSTQPARAIVNFVTKILIGSHRQNYT